MGSATNILVIRCEADTANAVVYMRSHPRQPFERLAIDLPRRDMRQVVRSRDGHSLSNVLVSYVKAVQGTLHPKQLSAIALTSPGLMDADGTGIVRASRLGIIQPVDIMKQIHTECGLPGHCFNDTWASAVGESHYGAGRRGSHSDFAYLLIGFGVGSVLVMNGQPYFGAGAAGHIGRMTMDPTGPIDDSTQARGDLQAFASLESMTRHLMLECRDEMEKETKSELERHAYYRFRQRISLATHPLDVTLETWQAGLEAGDPLVRSLVDDAARYVGLALSALIVLLNPPLVIVGGELVDGLPGFYELVHSYARRYTWSLPWRHSAVVRAELATNAQYLGARHLLLDRLGQTPP